MSVNFEFRFQRGSASRWTYLNPTLGPGEPGVEIDTGRFKIGDGHTLWSNLDYFLTESDVSSIVEVIVADTGGLSGDPRVGNMSELTTQAKTTIVAALNEVNDDVSLLLLYDNAKAG